MNAGGPALAVRSWMRRSVGALEVLSHKAAGQKAQVIALGQDRMRFADAADGGCGRVARGGAED